MATFSNGDRFPDRERDVWGAITSEHEHALEAKRVTSVNSSGSIINPATEDKQVDIINEIQTVSSNQTNNTQSTKIFANDNIVDTQHPLPTDGDSVYEKDINVSGSSIGTFTGDITSLVNDLDTTFSSAGHSSPAYFSIKLQRPINNTSIKFCAPIGKNFSNVKITLKDRAGTIVGQVDDSTNNTKYQSRPYDYPLTAWCTMLVEFYTTDDIDLNWALMEKSIDVHAIIRAAKPNGQLTDINATTGGNLKVSVEEYDDAVNPIRKDLEGVGDITVGTSQVEIAITGTPTHFIRIRADSSNSGTIFIGKTGVLADGSNDFARLDADDEMVIGYDDADNALYAISDVAGQKINVGVLL